MFDDMIQLFLFYLRLEKVSHTMGIWQAYETEKMCDKILNDCVVICRTNR